MWGAMVFRIQREREREREYPLQIEMLNNRRVMGEKELDL
jgi:hypothetical protein